MERLQLIQKLLSIESTKPYRASCCKIFLQRQVAESVNIFTHTSEQPNNICPEQTIACEFKVIWSAFPKNFDIIKTIEVYTNEFAIPRLNELEFVNGLIYANIWTSNEIAVIDPLSGKVLALIDATNLVNEGKGNGEVLNGIAFHAKSNKLYMTGKFWPTLFEVKVLK
jgi:hypothetical protein